MEWIDSSQDRSSCNQAEFLIAVDDFKDITSRPLMKSRASVVFDKFLLLGSPKECHGLLSAPEVEALAEQLLSLDTVRKGMFDPACSRAAAALDPLFERFFLNSPEFESLRDDLKNLDLRLHIDVDDHEHDAEHDHDHDAAAAGGSERSAGGK